MDRVDPRIAEEMKRLGAFDLDSCYSCGHCSALCPLCEGDISFPRRMIRYSMLGLEDRILASPEPWMCYYCGECSETCPRQADPGNLMMATRRFVTRRYVLGRIADVFYSAFSSVITWIILSALALLWVSLSYDSGMNMDEVDFLSFIHLEPIHNAGIALTVFIAAAMLMNLSVMIRAVKRGFKAEKPGIGIMARAAAFALGESATQQRFNLCDKDRTKRWMHLAISWGFVGMAIATVLVMGIDYEVLDISRGIPFAFGSVFGALTVVGTVWFLVQRIRKDDESFKYSQLSDWMFLVLILASVLSGYVMVLFKYMNMPAAAYISFAFHLVAVFDLLVSFPFTKFAHMIYRPLALWYSGLRQ
jgi:ferredoxin